MTDQTILSQLRDHLYIERSTNMFDVLELSLIQQAWDRIRKIENLVIAEGGQIDGVEERLALADERESIIETLDSISQRREEKIMIYAKYPEITTSVDRMLPHEKKLFQDVRSAVLVYRGAVKV